MNRARIIKIVLCAVLADFAVSLEVYADALPLILAAIPAAMRRERQAHGAVYLLSAANAAALVPDTDRDSGQNVPTVLMEPQSEDERPEVVLDGSGTAEEKHRVEAAAETGCLYAAVRGRGVIRRGR